MSGSEQSSGSREPSGVLSFGPFTFDACAGLLRRGEEETQLPPKAAKVLEILLARSGELVTKEELLDAVWEGAAVTEFSLTSAIKTLRSVLGDDARNPVYIQTLHRRGYRFIGTLERPLSHGGVAGGVAEAAVEEVSPGESVDRVAPDPGAFPTRWAAIAVLALVAIAAWLTWPAGSENLAEPSSETADSSPAFGLVVLPVPDLGATAEQQNFALGIGDDLATKLATVMPGVVPYSVARNFDLTDKTFDEIVTHFDARFILEFSVRWLPESETSYQVVAKLLRAADGEQVWPYRGEPGVLDVARMFDEQARLAGEVVAQLGITVPLGAQQIMAAWPTGNLAAWRQYVLGMEKLRAGSVYDVDKWAEAAERFESAASQHPDYLVAQAMKSVAWSYYPNTDRRRAGGELAKQLVAAHPQLPQAHWALGAFYYHATRGDWAALLGIDPERPDFQGYYALAVKELELARRGLPYSPDVELMLAWLHRRLGNWDQSIAIFERMRRLLPEETSVLVELATAYLLTKENEKADEILTGLISTNPIEWHYYSISAINHLAWGQALSTFREQLRAAPTREFAATDSGYATCHVLLAWILADAIERKFEDLLARRDASPHCTYANVGRTLYSLDLYAALAYRELGMNREAAAAIELAREDLEEMVNERLRNEGRHAALGLAYALSGRREEALSHARTAMSLRPISEDAFQGSEPVLVFIRILAQLGEIDEALAQLDELLKIPATVTIAFVRNDPFMDPIVADPRFRRLAEEYSPSIR